MFEYDKSYLDVFVRIDIVENGFNRDTKIR